MQVSSTWRWALSLVFALALGSVLRAQSFSIPGAPAIVAIPGVNHYPIKLAITATPATYASRLTCTSDATWVTPSIDAAHSSLVLTFATGTLISRSYTATIGVTDGTTTKQVFVQATVSPMNIVRLRADPSRALVYGVQQDPITPTNPGALVVYDPVHQQYLGELTVGSKPFGLAIRKDGTEALVACSATQTISAIDLQALTVTQSIALRNFGESNDSAAVSRVAYGPGSIIYFTDDAWAPVLHVYDRTAAADIQTLALDDKSSFFGFGDFAVSADQSSFYTWGQYGWSAGNAGSNIAEYAIASNGQLTFTTSVVPGSYTSFSRDPLSDPVLVSADGTKVLVKNEQMGGGVTLPSTLQSLANSALAISPNAEIFSTQKAIFSSTTGNSLYTLPISTSQVQAITWDYSRLVYFDPTAKTLGTVDLFKQIGLNSLGLNISPSIGAIVLPPSQLTWSTALGATGYQIYLGTSSAAVTTATTGSPEYLGQTNLASWTLANSLTPGATYYWRVDLVTSTGVTQGTVWSFTVSSLATNVASVTGGTVSAQTNFTVPVQLTSGNSGKSWSASSSASWIGFQATSGVTPATLQVVLDATQCKAGLNQGTVSLTTSDGTVTLPVALTVDPLTVTLMRSDPGSKMVYAISENTAATSVDRAYLLEIDASAKTVTRVVPVGNSATDLAIHHGDNRIYVPNWNGGSLLGVNLTTFAVEKTYAFTPFGGMGYGGGDVYRVSAGAAGRLVVEQEDQWIQIEIFDTVAGKVLGTQSEREGGGSYAPDQRYYYHGEDNISDAALVKYDTVADKFSSVASVSGQATPNVSYYGSRTVVVTEDGSRVFWNGGAYTNTLSTLWLIGDQIYTATPDGRYAISGTKVYDVNAKQAVLALPVTVTAAAYNSTAARLVIPNGSNFSFYAIDPNATLAAPVLTGSATNSNSAVLNWTVDGLGFSFTLQELTPGAANWTDVSSGVAATASTYTVTGLSAGSAYQFRIKTNSPNSSSTWSNIVAVNTAVSIPVITTQPVSQAAHPGDSVTLTVASSGGGTMSYQWYKNGTALPGATATTLTLSNVTASDAASYSVMVTNPGGTTTSFSVSVAINSSKLSNLSVMSSAGAGTQALSAGFSISGTTKSVLIRASGPALLSFGVSGVLVDPQLTLYQGSAAIGSNDNWNQATNAVQVAAVAAQLGAFTLPANGLDSALLASLTGGVYSAQVSGGRPGTALLEVYDADTAGTSRLVNLSALSSITSTTPLSVGFVISGTSSKTVLIRAIGPGLIGLGVTNAISDPRLDLYLPGSSSALLSNDNWGGLASSAATFAQVGAFALDPTSKDAVLIATLNAGSYSAVASGVNGATGAALIEVYEVK